MSHFSQSIGLMTKSGEVLTGSATGIFKLSNR